MKKLLEVLYYLSKSMTFWALCQYKNGNKMDNCYIMWEADDKHFIISHQRLYTWAFRKFLSMKWGTIKLGNDV